ncbi:MAG: hypothetical protein KF886_01800 [Candidatus Hydrogenedentes bacterium]|nr:hypothetical protein [Candidatus Hydrogenedentota bacterium]
MEREFRRFGDRYQVTCCPELMAAYRNEDSPWSESEAEVAAAIAWGMEKARLLRWVRAQMRRRLTARQRRCIELYYFEGLTHEEVGRRLGCSTSSSCRSVQRGIARLRIAARVDPPGGVRRLFRR